MMMLPPAEGTCPVCATDHDDDAPHNAVSLYYQYRFYSIRGRWPTWADAVAHCKPLIREYWERQLRNKGKWTEPEDGDPIGDPPAESIAMAIGSPDSTDLRTEEI